MRMVFIVAGIGLVGSLVAGWSQFRGRRDLAEKAVRVAFLISATLVFYVVWHLLQALPALVPFS